MPEVPGLWDTNEKDSRVGGRVDYTESSRPV